MTRQIAAGPPGSPQWRSRDECGANAGPTNTKVRQLARLRSPHSDLSGEAKSKPELELQLEPEPEPELGGDAADVEANKVRDRALFQAASLPYL